MVILIIYGKAADKRSVIYSNSALKHNQKIDIGLKDQERENEETTSSKSSRTKKDKRVRTTILQRDIRKRKTFLEKLVHAMKNAHNLFSIFLRNDSQLTRPVRFVQYCLRWLGVLAVTSIFFRSMSGKSYSFVQIVIVSTFSFLFVTPISILLQWLLTRPKVEITRRKHMVGGKDKPHQSNSKFFGGVALAIFYGLISIMLILLIAVNSPQEVNDDLLSGFFIQFAQDIFLNQMVKVMLHYLILLALTKKQCLCAKGMLMKILDHNLYIAFR
jgi:hypothetical protein